MKYTIKPISSTETHPVRHLVLRKGKPIESCIFDGDALETTFHLGLYLKNDLIAVCSFFKNTHKLLLEAVQYQLRGMAVLETHQGLGLGTIILTHGETVLKQQNITIIWCNSREKATKFYKKMGYNIIGEPFEIKDIGLHYSMYKPL